MMQKKACFLRRNSFADLDDCSDMPFRSAGIPRMICPYQGASDQLIEPRLRISAGGLCRCKVVLRNPEDALDHVVISHAKLNVGLATEPGVLV